MPLPFLSQPAKKEERGGDKKRRRGTLLQWTAKDYDTDRRRRDRQRSRETDPGQGGGFQTRTATSAFPNPPSFSRKKRVFWDAVVSLVRHSSKSEEFFFRAWDRGEKQARLAFWKGGRQMDFFCLLVFPGKNFIQIKELQSTLPVSLPHLSTKCLSLFLSRPFSSSSLGWWWMVRIGGNDGNCSFHRFCPRGKKTVYCLSVPST